MYPFLTHPFPTRGLSVMLEVFGQLGGGGVAPFRLLAQRLEHDAVEVAMQPARELSRRGPAAGGSIGIDLPGNLAGRRRIGLQDRAFHLLAGEGRDRKSTRLNSRH